MKTLLTGELSEDYKKEQKGKEQDWERFQILLDCLFEDYKTGTLKLDRLCWWAVTLAKEFEGDVFPMLPARGRNQLIGELIMKAVSHQAPGKQLTPSKTIKNTIIKLVRMAQEKDDKKLQREDENSAFLYIASRMKKLGVEIEARTVEDYWQKKD